jgi:hypothetical protein
MPATPCAPEVVVWAHAGNTKKANVSRLLIFIANLPGVNSGAVNFGGESSKLRAVALSG